MLACSLGKESKGLMASEEWNFLLNFAQSLNGSPKDTENADVTKEDADIGNSWHLILSNARDLFRKFNCFYLQMLSWNVLLKM